MMLEKRLYQLLFRHACVVVPQFGAFLTEKLPARISPQQHTLYPPSRRLYFNAQLTHNDGLLVHLWMAENECSYEQALAQIAAEVAQWQLQLQRDQVLHLPLLGHFTQADNQAVVFHPKDDANFLKASFGLSPVSIQGLAREEQAVAAVPATTTSESEFELTDHAAADMEVATKIRKPSQPWSYWNYAAVYLMGFGLMGYMGIQSYQWWQNRQNAEALAVHARVEQQVKQKIQAASFVIEPRISAANDTKAPANNTIYHVVTGSFRDMRHAQAAFKNLIAQGYQAHILPINNKGLHPVVYGSFTQLDQAEMLLQQVRQHQADAWLYMQ